MLKISSKTLKILTLIIIIHFSNLDTTTTIITTLATSVIRFAAIVAVYN
jgi:hypothetical protein